MNEIANLCELVGANVDDIRRGIGTDSRIGKRFLFAGIGYGGSCFPKDVQALAKTSEENNYQFHILDSVMKVNEKQKTKLIPIIKNIAVKEDIQEQKENLGKKVVMVNLVKKEIRVTKAQLEVLEQQEVLVPQEVQEPQGLLALLA
mgnify:CR=1 FL=1